MPHPCFTLHTIYENHEYLVNAEVWTSLYATLHTRFEADLEREKNKRDSLWRWFSPRRLFSTTAAIL